MAMAAPAQAATVTAYYEASWASLPAATMTLSVDRDTDRYRDAIHVETIGVPRWLIHFRTTVESDGVMEADGKARPAHYNVDYDLRRYRNQRVRMIFVDRDGTLIGERTVDDSSNKPPLPEKYRRGTIDPMSAFAVLRHDLRGRTMKVGDRFTIPVFDDVRRYDVKVTVVSVDDLDKLVHLHVDLLPIAGFKDKHEDGNDPEDAPRPMELTFRDDANLLPVRMEIAVGWLPLVIRFRYLCADAQHCEPPAKK
jgi:hypothetical protein